MIKVKKIKEKMYTREEVKDISLRYTTYVSVQIKVNRSWEHALPFNQWFEQNVK